MRPTREHATNTGRTYMVTSSTWGRRSLFSREHWAKLLIDTLYHYRGSAYLLHEFVIVPDHIHLLITLLAILEKAVQFIKGGFSYRARKELGSNMEVWQKGFSDHRIRDAEDYWRHVEYIRQNPVRKHLCGLANEYPYSSAFAEFELDPVPQGLKPELFVELVTARLEGVPFQSKTSLDTARAPLFQSDMLDGAAEAARFHDSSESGGFELDAVPQGLKPESLSGPATARLEGVPFQSDTSPQRRPVRSESLEAAADAVLPEFKTKIA